MAYTAFDRFLAWCRFRAATPHIRFQSRVCDLGCGAGAPFLHHIESRLASGVGLDEYAGEPTKEKISVVHANITVRLPLESRQFDHVTMLAVLEHLEEPERVLAEAYRLLRPGGSLIITWPSILVDPILEVLTRIGLVNDELGFDQHQPRIPVAKLREMLHEMGFAQIENGTFELGLNNWLVAHKKSLMEKDAQSSLALSLLKRAHGNAVFKRRVRVLAESLGARIPSGASVLDIGCGDGTIARMIMDRNPTVKIQGVEIAPRPTCRIACKPFDGTIIPHAPGSFDVCMFVDVLHHTHWIEALLLEACRVSRRYVLIKDHLAENRLDFKTLQFMDWVGNRPHGVVLPYNYKSSNQWSRYFSNAGLTTLARQDRVKLYPFLFSILFGRKLHFIELLEKTEQPA